MTDVTAEAADLLEELGLQLYRVADDKEALDDALDMAEALREPELGGLHIEDPKPMDEVEDVLEAWIEGLGITEGDLVRDENPPKWARRASNGNHFEVVNLTDTPAKAYTLEIDGRMTTVAKENPGYSPESPVIEVSPLNSDKEFAYPADRLEQL